MSNRVDKYSELDYKKDKFEGKLPLVEIVIMIFGLLVNKIMSLKFWLSKKVDFYLDKKIDKLDPSNIYTTSYHNKYSCYQCGYKSNILDPEKVSILRGFHSLFIHFNITPLVKGVLYKFGWSWYGKMVE